MIGFAAVIVMVIVVLMSVEHYTVANWLWMLLFALIALATLREMVRS